MSNLPRAYLRMDPNMHNHPDPGSLVIIICLANQQPHRGRFKSLHFLSRALGKRKLSEAIDRRDIVKSGDVYYVAGWDEWQEGDLTVGERMNRVRGRRTAEIRDSAKSNRNGAVTQASPGRIHASKTIDVDVDVDVTPPPPRVIPPVPNDADCQAAANELVKAIRRAREVTGLDGAEILGHSTVRGKGSVIVNPSVCSPAALKLWQVTTERVYGFVAAWEADRREAQSKRVKGTGKGAPVWDRPDGAAADAASNAVAWVQAHWPSEFRPQSRDALENCLAGLSPSSELRGEILTHLLFGRYPHLSRRAESEAVA